MTQPSWASAIAARTRAQNSSTVGSAQLGPLWIASNSMNGTPIRRASSAPKVDLPEPLEPFTAMRRSGLLPSPGERCTPSLWATGHLPYRGRTAGLVSPERPVSFVPGLNGRVGCAVVRSWLLALGLTIAGLGVLVWLIPSAPMTGDGQYYVEFVRNGLQHGASTWHERRLLGPAIVRALPLDPLNGFFVLTIASLAATALMTWRAASDLIGSERRALIAVPLLLGTWLVAPNIREYALVDPLAWAFVAAIWLCTVRRQWLLAAVLGGSGVLAKEVVVLAAVSAAVAAWDRNRAWQALIVVAPAIIVAVALTLVFPGSGTDATSYVLKWVRDGLGSLG